jgi:hypothetical protein
VFSSCRSHSERSEESPCDFRARSFAALRMTWDALVKLFYFGVCESLQSLLFEKTLRFAACAIGIIDVRI